MNVGDYVRTKKQGIKRIDKIFENATVNKYGYEDKNNDYEYFVIRTDEIIKSSPQIIDLIEKNDLLKIEYRVLPDATQTEIVQVIENKDKKLFVHLWKGDYFIEDISKNGMIKQILTHEQFESEAYRVEE